MKIFGVEGVPGRKVNRSGADISKYQMDVTIPILGLRLRFSYIRTRGVRGSRMAYR